MKTFNVTATITTRATRFATTHTSQIQAKSATDARRKVAAAWAEQPRTTTRAAAFLINSVEAA